MKSEKNRRNEEELVVFFLFFFFCWLVGFMAYQSLNVIYRQILFIRIYIIKYI